MLGRYVAGTLLILGVAMLMAPEGPEKKTQVSVARTETSPVALATAEPVAMAAAARNAAEPRAEAQLASLSAPAEAADDGLQVGIEAALVQALALDSTETEAEAAILDSAEDLSEAERATEEGEETDLSMTFAGMSLSLDAPQSGRLMLDDSDALTVLATEALAGGPADPAARILFVTGTRVNVRSGPSTQFSVVDTVALGDPVELVAFEGQDWARIRVGEDGQTGYMSRKFLANEPADG